MHFVPPRPANSDITGPEKKGQLQLSLFFTHAAMALPSLMPHQRPYLAAEALAETVPL